MEDCEKKMKVGKGEEEEKKEKEVGKEKNECGKDMMGEIGGVEIEIKQCGAIRAEV